MAGRVTSARLPSVSSSPTGGELTAFVRAVQGHPLFSYAMVDVELDGTTNAQNFRHGLGRAFIGAVYCGGGNTSVMFGIANADVVKGLPLDPAIWFRVKPSAGTSASYKFLVF